MSVWYRAQWGQGTHVRLVLFQKAEVWLKHEGNVGQ